METINLKTRIGDDGVLKLEVPTGLTAREVEVVLVMQTTESQAVDENGWPIGFFERTYGTFADDPIDRPPPLPLEEREPIE